MVTINTQATELARPTKERTIQIVILTVMDLVEILTPQIIIKPAWPSEVAGSKDLN